MPTKKATHQKTKRHNRDLVLRTIFNQQPISRAQIARITKLTRATVSEMVNDCLEEGLVEEVGLGTSMGGKSPILLSIVADSHFLIGVNLGQDKFTGAIVNLLGEIKETVEIDIKYVDRLHALQYVFQIIDQLVRMPYEPIVGIGIGTPGLVNTREGIIVNAVNLDWQDFPLAHLLMDRYHMPVHLLNDSQALSIGEYVYNDKHGSDGNLVVVNVRYGIGAGILINGQLFQGDGGSAGEIGHLTVEKNGRLCRCGRYGCLETVSSATAVLQRAEELLEKFPSSQLNELNQKPNLNNLLSAYKTNDPLAIKVVNESAFYLGVVIANLVGTLNIQRIVIAGEMSRFGEPYIDEIYKSMRSACLDQMAQDTEIKIGRLDSQGYLVGASASLLLSDFSLLFANNDE